LLPCENWVTVKKEYILLIIVSKWGKAHFVHIDLFSLVEETHVYLQRTPSVLEAGASSTLFPCENWGSFWMECFLQLRCFKEEIDSLFSKESYSAELKKTCISPKKPIHVRSFSNEHMVLCEIRVSFWKKYFLQIRIM
jgi:hypothetical protein